MSSVVGRPWAEQSRETYWPTKEDMASPPRNSGSWDGWWTLRNGPVYSIFDTGLNAARLRGAGILPIMSLDHGQAARATSRQN
jgi:hypothetical protein